NASDRNHAQIIVCNLNMHKASNNQQAAIATVEQVANRPAGKQVPFTMLILVLVPQLDKAQAMQLRTLYARLMLLKRVFFRAEMAGERQVLTLGGKGSSLSLAFFSSFATTNPPQILKFDPSALARLSSFPLGHSEIKNEESVENRSKGANVAVIGANSTSAFASTAATDAVEATTSTTELARCSCC
nr:histidine--tRNA ligase, cytoplasmic [Tanacetum cinerariifolium]